MLGKIRMRKTYSGGFKEMIVNVNVNGNLKIRET